MFNRIKIEKLKIKYAPPGKPRAELEETLRKATANNAYADVVALLPEVKNIDDPGLTSGLTALHRAAQKGYQNIFQLLEQNGANCETPNIMDGNKNALDYALENKHKAIITKRLTYQFLFALPEEILHFQIMGYLAQSDITSAMQVSGSIYRNSVYKNFYRTNSRISSGDKINYLSSWHFHCIFPYDAVNPHLLSLQELTAWADNRFDFKINPSHLQNYNLLSVLRKNYLSDEILQELLSRPEMVDLFFTSDRLFLFQKRVFNDRTVKRILSDNDPGFFKLIMHIGKDEVLAEKYSIDHIWDSKSRIQNAIADVFEAGEFMFETITSLSSIFRYADISDFLTHRMRP